MAFFGVEVEESKDLDLFIEETNKRFEGNNLVYNPFNARIIRRENKLFVYICPVYFNYPKLAFLFTSIGYLGFVGLKFSYWLIPPIIFLCLNVFWVGYFYFLIMKWGSRKKGYKGMFKYISKDEFARELIFWDSKIL